MREPGLYIVDGVEEVVYPEVFPASRIIDEMINDAVLRAVSTNIIDPINSSLLGVASEDAVKSISSSLFYVLPDSRDITSLIVGRIPVQQLLGHILHSSDFLPSVFPDVNNCLINSKSAKNTFVTYEADTDTLYLCHIMKDSSVLRRYLRATPAVFITVAEGTVLIKLPLWYSAEDACGLINAVSIIPTLLNVYYKLLTRFESCKDYQSEFPKFESL